MKLIPLPHDQSPSGGLVQTVVIVGLLQSLCEAFVNPSANENGAVVQQDLTCWTCPNKTDNNECNNWAPDLPCSSNHTVCKTVHRFHSTKGHSIVVNKMCAPKHECTKEHVGCRLTDKQNVKECISCCTESYCNELIPSNISSAIALSTIDLGLSGSHRTLANHITTLLVAIVTIFVMTLTR